MNFGGNIVQLLKTWIKFNVFLIRAIKKIEIFTFLQKSAISFRNIWSRMNYRD